MHERFRKNNLKIRLINSAFYRAATYLLPAGYLNCGIWLAQKLMTIFYMDYFHEDAKIKSQLKEK